VIAITSAAFAPPDVFEMRASRKAVEDINVNFPNCFAE